MAKVNGISGPIDVSDLGFTLMHEHILAMSWAARQGITGWFDRDRFVLEATAELISAKQRGVKTILDATPINLGRDIHLMAEVAGRAGMQVIAATGFYWTEEPFLANWDADRLVEYLLPDITQGIQGTGIKAGVIKCATDEPGVTDLNRKLLQVAARLHRATGVPITTHTSVHNRSGLDQQAVFRDEGVDLSRVIVGHCGDTEDLEYLEKVLSAGSYIGMDRFGLDFFLPSEARINTVAELCRRGYAKQMVLSHDAACLIDWFPRESPQQVLPDWNLRFIPDKILPALRERGVTDQQIKQMTVDNPRCIFETTQVGYR